MQYTDYSDAVLSWFEKQQILALAESSQSGPNLTNVFTDRRMHGEKMHRPLNRIKPTCGSDRTIVSNVSGNRKQVFFRLA